MRHTKNNSAFNRIAQVEFSNTVDRGGRHGVNMGVGGRSGVGGEGLTVSTIVGRYGECTAN